jgi:hypothetical protein
MKSLFGVLLVSGLFLASEQSFAEPHEKGGRAEADITKKIEPPYYTGVLTTEPRQIGEEFRLCPVLKDEASGKIYRIRTYTDSPCKVAIENCKAGEKCVIKGVVNSEGDIFAEEFTSFAPPIAPMEVTISKKTSTGAKFKMVSKEELKKILKPTEMKIEEAVKKFGEAWEDPSHMIWGDIAKKADGSPLYLSHADAKAYCEGIGAELPTGYYEKDSNTHGFWEESDFVRLRKYMGAEVMKSESQEFNGPPSYKPQVLPNLRDRHWSSSLSTSFGARYFDGETGGIRWFYRAINPKRGENFVTRCVKRIKVGS